MEIHEIVDNLAKYKLTDIMINEPLKNHTSIKIGGEAKLLVMPKTKKQVIDCINFFEKVGMKYFVLGNGTNVLCSDNGFDGAVIKLSKNLNVCRKINNGVYADAGVSLFQLGRFCRENNLSGLEFSYGIPGSVGGAVCMNAGSHNDCIGNHVQFVWVLCDGKIKKLSQAEMCFEYRNSLIKKQNLIVLGVKFLLETKPKQQIEMLQNKHFQQKLSLQPYNELSFGSCFKRRGDVAISKIIDDMGLKGYKVGDVAISEKHAGFIINKGNGTCKDCLKLIQYVQKKIKKAHKFVPELEVVLVGDIKNDIIWWLSHTYKVQS